MRCIGQNEQAGLLISHLYACQEFIVGVTPVVAALVLLHERRLHYIVERTGESLVRNEAHDLFVYILAETTGTEIYIAYILIRFALLLVVRALVLVDRIYGVTVHNLLTCTAQLYTVEGIRLQRTCNNLIVLVVVCGVDVCYTYGSSLGIAVIVCDIAVIIYRHLKVVIDVEYILAQHIVYLVAHTGTIHCLVLIDKCKHLANLHVCREC